MLPLGGAGFLFPSSLGYLSLSGNGLFLDVGLSFSTSWGQKVGSEDGAWPKMVCGVPVATQSCSWSSNDLVIMDAIRISLESILFSTLYFRITGAVYSEVVISR